MVEGEGKRDIVIIKNFLPPDSIYINVCVCRLNKLELFSLLIHVVSDIQLFRDGCLLHSQYSTKVIKTKSSNVSTTGLVRLVLLVSVCEPRSLYIVIIL